MPAKPTPKAASDFNDKAKTHLYSVGAAPKKKSGKKISTDFSDNVEKMIEKIRKLAASEGYGKQVQIKRDDGSLGKLGIFFMQAPEKFASLVRKMDGIHYVEKSGNSTATKKSIPSGLRKSK